MKRFKFAVLVLPLLMLSLFGLRMVARERERKIRAVFEAVNAGGDAARIRDACRGGVDISAINGTNHGAFTPLQTAAQVGGDEAIQALLDCGVDVDATPTAFKMTPLMIAAMNGFPSTVRLLLSRGADPNRKAGRAGTALYFARVQIGAAKKREPDAKRLETIRLLRQVTR